MTATSRSYLAFVPQHTASKHGVLAGVERGDGPEAEPLVALPDALSATTLASALNGVLPATFLGELLAGLHRLTQHGRFDLLYLGRFPLEPEHDQPVLDGFVSPAYRHCTFGYLLTRAAIDLLLATSLEGAIVPVDEFLPSPYVDHPRPDLRARFPKRLTALAFDPPLVRQRPKDEAGSDTEDSAFVEQTRHSSSPDPNLNREVRRRGVTWVATASGG